MRQHRYGARVNTCTSADGTRGAYAALLCGPAGPGATPLGARRVCWASGSPVLCRAPGTAPPVRWRGRHGIPHASSGLAAGGMQSRGQAARDATSTAAGQQCGSAAGPALPAFAHAARPRRTPQPAPKPGCWEPGDRARVVGVHARGAASLPPLMGWLFAVAAGHVAPPVPSSPQCAVARLSVCRCAV